jgi:hypothetical protein
MGRSSVCGRLDFVPPATSRGLLFLLRRHTRNSVCLFRSGIFLCLDLCHVLLPGRLAGKLEVPSMRPGVLPGCILSQPFWRPLFPLQPSQVVRFRDRRNYFPTQVPLSLGPCRATKSLINVARANGKSRGDDVGNGSENGGGSCYAFCDESCCLYSH